VTFEDSLSDSVVRAMHEARNGSLEKALVLTVDGGGPWLKFGYRGEREDLYFAEFCPGEGQPVLEGELRECCARFLMAVSKENSPIWLASRGMILQSTNPGIMKGFHELRDEHGQIRTPVAQIAPKPAPPPALS